MIHVQIRMPDGTEPFFLVNENVCVSKVLKELAAYAKRDETANMQLFDELDQRAIAGDVSLLELGIKSGRLLSLQTETEEE